MQAPTVAKQARPDQQRDDRGLVPPAGRLRRRPMMIVVSIALVVLGGIAGLVVWMVSTTATEVVAVRTAVDRGEVIAAENLTVVRISLDPSLQVVPGAQLGELVGKRAAADLSAGSLVGPTAVTDQAIPPTGRSIVGLALTSGQLPAEPLRPGDLVRVVLTPTASVGEAQAAPLVVDAVVHGVSQLAADGQTVVVDVEVPSSRAPEVAARAGTGRASVVLDARER